MWRFDDYTLDTARYELKCGENVVRVEPQVFDVLAQRIEEQGGAMGRLAGEVEASALALQGLREKMERELWKGVLKGEAAMMEKERALNEVQGKREALWAQRDGLVTSMQGELTNEQARMAAAWQQGQGAWHALQAEHNELRVELQQRRLDGERGSESLQREIGRVGEQLQAERQLLQQEEKAKLQYEELVERAEKQFEECEYAAVSVTCLTWPLEVEEYHAHQKELADLDRKNQMSPRSS